MVDYSTPCHHLHTNKALHLPLDPETHTRINCDLCQHPILGIGRTSTQTTLASIETNATGHHPWREEPDVASGDDHTSVSSPVQSPPLRVDTSGLSGALSTIAEGGSPAQQSSAVLTPPKSGDARSDRSIPHEWVHRQHAPSDLEHETLERNITDTVPSAGSYGNPISQIASGSDAPPADGMAGAQPSTSAESSTGFWARLSQRRLHDRLRRHVQKRRSFNIRRLGLHVDVSPTPSAPGRPPLLAASASSSCPNKKTNNTSPTNDANAKPAAGPTTGVMTPVRSTPVHILSTASVQQPASAHPDPLIGRTPTLQQKYDRISARRREATLKWQVESASKCECRSQCQCRGGSVESNAASVGPDPSDRSILVPAYSLGHLLSNSSESSGSRSSSGVDRSSFYVGIGSHLRSEPLVNLTDDARVVPVMEGQQVASDRLSQTSTAYVRSNGSSISLTSRGPASLRRSSTTPASLPRRSAEGFRPEVMEVVQNRDIPGSDPNLASPLPEVETKADELSESGGDTTLVSVSMVDGNTPILDLSGGFAAWCPVKAVSRASNLANSADQPTKFWWGDWDCFLEFQMMSNMGALFGWAVSIEAPTMGGSTGCAVREGCRILRKQHARWSLWRSDLPRRIVTHLIQVYWAPMLPAM
ncbi:MAG: hypothetical protein Q9182_001636 [Xanthomendoza sp. 2 TL-2023]